MSKSTFTSQSEKSSQAAAARKEERAAGIAHIQDNRPTVAVQRKMSRFMRKGSSALQRKALNTPVQMMTKEEEEPLQSKSANQSPVQRKTGNGLPAEVNSKLESTLGADFSGVNIHTNSGSAAQMNARAYTQGNDVHFAPGQFKPDTSEGKKLIGHEFTHIVQQSQGRVKPTTKVNGMPVNDDRGLEGEADRIGDKVAQM